MNIQETIQDAEVSSSSSPTSPHVVMSNTRETYLSGNRMLTVKALANKGISNFSIIPSHVQFPSGHQLDIQKINPQHNDDSCFIGIEDIGKLNILSQNVTLLANSTFIRSLYNDVPTFYCNFIFGYGSSEASFYSSLYRGSKDPVSMLPVCVEILILNTKTIEELTVILLNAKLSMPAITFNQLFLTGIMSLPPLLSHNQIKSTSE